MKKGAPTKYKAEFAEQARCACLVGATNEDLGVVFDVSTSTIDNWLVSKPEFLGAVKGGREFADQKVAESLYNTALEGNTTAQIFWLKNRRRKEWRDKQEIDHTTNGESINKIERTIIDERPKDSNS